MALVGWTALRQEDVRALNVIYKTVVRTVARYGAECWSETKEMESRITVTKTKILRWMTRVTRHDRIRKDAIRQKFIDGPIADEMREARLRWYAHVLRGKKEPP